MKLNGIGGTGSGKLGSMVFATVAGEQVVRQYQPNVANPSTPSQVDQRARMKLMSQLAASMAPVIVIQKDGLKSARNQFIAKNFDQSMANDGVAQITIENVQLTNGNAGLPGIVATRDAATGVQISLDSRADAAITRVVYILYMKTSENTLQYVQSVICETPTDDGTFPATLVYTEGDIVLFAYGMKDLSAKASAKYANLNAQTGEDIARLISSRKINTSDYQFTMTRGATMFAGENSIEQLGPDEFRVFLTPSGPGSVSGAGVKQRGESVTVVATPSNGSQFLGWKVNGSDTYVSVEASYTFEMPASTVDLIAVFRDPSASNFIVTLNKGTGCASVTGGGEIERGQSATVRATGQSSYSFVGWFDNANGDGTAKSTSSTYTFTPTSDVTLWAIYVYDD